MNERACADWQGILAMHAIGMATVEESRDLHEHVGHCPTCSQDADDVRSAAGALRYLEPAQVDRLEWQSADLATLTPLDGDLAGGDGDGDASWERGAGPASVPGQLSGAATHLTNGKRRRLTAGISAAVLAAAAAVVAVASLGGTSPPPGRTAALTGQKGVQASVSLASRSWGTLATLRESGQAPGQILTVSMRTSSGHWWVAGSYRTTAGTGPLEVQLSCAVQSDRINDVWVSDQRGRTVLTGYVP